MGDVIAGKISFRPAVYTWILSACSRCLEVGSLMVHSSAAVKLDDMENFDRIFII